MGNLRTCFVQAFAVLATEQAPAPGSNEKHKMTINDVNGLKDFFKTDNTVTPAKIRALTIVADELSEDSDLQEVLRNLAHFLEFTGVAGRSDFLGCLVLDIRPFEKFSPGSLAAQYSPIEVILDCMPGIRSFPITTKRQDWTWTRPRSNEKSLSRRLCDAQDFYLHIMRVYRFGLKRFVAFS